MNEVVTYIPPFIRSLTRSQSGLQYIPRTNQWAAYLDRVRTHLYGQLPLFLPSFIQELSYLFFFYHPFPFFHCPYIYILTSLAGHFVPLQASPAGLLGHFAPWGLALAFTVASLPQTSCFALAFSVTSLPQTLRFMLAFSVTSLLQASRTRTCLKK